MDFTIYQALMLLIGMSLYHVTVECREELTTQNVTEYDRSFQRVLSRRKRFLVYRPGSNLLLTASLVKPLGFRRPTGHNLIIEWDFFYPLITTWHQPEVTLRPPTTRATTTEFPIEIVESWEAPKEVFQPEGGWTNDVIQQINQDNEKLTASRRIIEEASNEHNLFNFKPPPISMKWNPMFYRQSQPHPPLNRNNFSFNQQLLSQQPQQQQQLSRTFIAADNKQKNFIPWGRSLKSNDDENWKHFRAHRDRRDLYERLQSATPGNNSGYIRSCLLRSICEAQHFLNPRGYSLLHDLLRVVFTIPIKDNMNDDYSDAMRASDQDCAELYRENCPVSFLAILFH